jgi:hypothetical protein
MEKQKIKNDQDFYYGGILKIKPKKLIIKREFNKNNIISLEDILKISKENIIQPYN